MAPFCLRRALRRAERFLIAKIYDLCGLPLMWLRFCVFLLSRGKSLNLCLIAFIRFSW